MGHLKVNLNLYLFYTYKYFDFVCRSVFNKTFISSAIAQRVKTTTYLRSKLFEIYHPFLNLSVPFYMAKPLIQIEKLTFYCYWNLFQLRHIGHKLTRYVMETFLNLCFPISLNVSDGKKIRYKMIIYIMKDGEKLYD